MQKYFFSLVIFLFGIANIAMAQTLTACKSVDKDGHAVNAGQEFTVPKNGAPVALLLTFSAAARPSAVNYDVYKVVNGKEVFSTSMKQPIEPGKSWFSKEIVFYDPGIYRVYAYDDKDNLITKTNFSIKQSSN